MAVQTQCPNCGGFKVSTRTRYVKRKIGKETGISLGGEFLRGLASILLLLGIVYFCWKAFEADGANFWGQAFMGFFAAVGVVLLLRLILTDKPDSKSFHHECVLCGYNWHRLEYDPEPPVTVRPDLLQKGAEELKRREDSAASAAAAAYFLEQQRRNRK